MSEQSKPRICQVLGVEVGEQFNVVGTSGVVDRCAMFIDVDGCVKWEDRDIPLASTLCELINHPDRIVRQPRLTPDELAICRLVGAKWVSRDGDGCIRLWDNEPTYVDGAYYSGGKSVPAVIVGNLYHNKAIFPSIHPGDCICVEEAVDNE